MPVQEDCTQPAFQIIAMLLYFSKAPCLIDANIVVLLAEKSVL